MSYEHLGFIDAVAALARTAGLALPAQAQQTEQAFTHLYEALTFAADFYQQQLKQSSEAIAYCKMRQITGKIAKEYSLGFAKPSWDALYKAALANGFNEQILLQAGLIVKNDEGRCYDRFRARLMFPIRDRRGRVIAFGGRVIDDQLPKYLNSPETPIFHKGQELYGLWEARKKQHQLRRLLVVEGYMDVIALAQQGIAEAVATLGTATTVEHLQLIFRHTKELVFCFDGDEAGLKAAQRALETVLPLLHDNISIRFLLLPINEDPDSFIKKEGKESFLRRVEQAVTLGDFLLQQLSAHHDIQTIDGRARFASDAMQRIHRIPDGVFKQLLTDKVQQIAQLHFSAAPRKRIVSKINTLGQPSVMRKALILLIQYPELIKVVPEPFPELTLAGSDLLVALIDNLKQQPAANTGILLERFRGTPIDALLNKIAIEPQVTPPEGIEHEFTDTLKRLCSEQRLVQINHLMAKAAIIPGLSAEEKQQLQALIRVQNNAE